MKKAKIGFMTLVATVFLLGFVQKVDIKFLIQTDAGFSRAGLFCIGMTISEARVSAKEYNAKIVDEESGPYDQGRIRKSLKFVSGGPERAALMRTPPAMEFLFEDANSSENIESAKLIEIVVHSPRFELPNGLKTGLNLSKSRNDLRNGAAKFGRNEIGYWAYYDLTDFPNLHFYLSPDLWEIFGESLPDVSKQYKEAIPIDVFPNRAVIRFIKLGASERD